MHAITWKASPIPPPVAEAKAAELAIGEAIRLGFRSIIFEGDALNIITPLKDWSYIPDWAIQAYATKSREMLGSSFDNWGVSKVNRSANAMAHNLAQWACDCNIFGIYVPSSLPPLVGDVDGRGASVCSSFS